MFCSLDTIVFVAAVLGEADTFHAKWHSFRHKASGHDLVVTGAVLSEYESKVEGIGRTDGRSGRAEEIIGDLYRAASMIPVTIDTIEDVPAFITSMKLNQHSGRLVTSLAAKASGPDDLAAHVIEIADAFQWTVAVNKREFLSSVSIRSPMDTVLVTSIEGALKSAIGTGGKSWGNDLWIIAETHALAIEIGDFVMFITEDRRHFNPSHIAEILKVLGGKTIQEFRDLDCAALAA